MDTQPGTSRRRRDLSDVYTFHVKVPDGVSTLAASYDILEVPRRANTIGTNFEADYINAAHMAEMYHSLGLQTLPDGTLQDVWLGNPAYVAGLGPGDKQTAVNGKPYTAEVLTEAVKAAKTNTSPLTLTALRDDE